MSSTPPELFWISGSPFAWQVMLTMEAKELPYTPRLLEASRGEHKKPEFLALNPRGKVPVLRDGDLVLYESIAIMQYLEAKHPARPMFGRTAYETAAIWRSISEFSCYLQPALVRITYPLLTGKSDEKAADVLEAAPEVHAELDKLEASFAEGGSLAATRITAADITAYPFLKLLRRAAGKDAASRFDLGVLPFDGRFPRLAARMTQMEQMPGYERTYPPHWRQ